MSMSKATYHFSGCCATCRRFGCGVALCGFTVQVDGVATRSCITAVQSITDAEITIIEAIGAAQADARIQKAWRGSRGGSMRLLPVGPDHVCLVAIRRKYRHGHTRLYRQTG